MTARPSKDELDGTILDPDRVRRAMVTDARQVQARSDFPPPAYDAGGAGAVDEHPPVRRGALPTQWAEDGTVTRDVTTVHLPAKPAGPAGVSENPDWLATFGEVIAMALTAAANTDDPHVNELDACPQCVGPHYDVPGALCPLHKAGPGPRGAVPGGPRRDAAHPAHRTTGTGTPDRRQPHQPAAARWPDPGRS